MQITVIFITSSIACRNMLLIWFSSFDWISSIFIYSFTSSYHPFLIEMFSKNGLVQDLSLAYKCNCWKHTIKKMCFGKSKIIYQYLFYRLFFQAVLYCWKNFSEVAASMLLTWIMDFTFLPNIFPHHFFQFTQNLYSHHVPLAKFTENHKILIISFFFLLFFILESPGLCKIIK